MKVLVTGGTGYIGSHTVVELQQKGYEVVIADNLINSHRDVVDRIEKITGIKPCFEQIDLTVEKGVKQMFDKHGDIHSVIHFAALKAVGESVKQPLRYYHNNIESLINILDAMNRIGSKTIVFSSSCTVYGQPEKLPVTELSPIQPACSPYGHTKQICEEIIANTLSVSELNGVLLRYFNPVGAHPSALIGELPLGAPNNLVPCITQTAIGKRPALKVFGDNYNTPDGTAVRDYIHVVDLAKSHVVALERLFNKKNKKNLEIFNIGTGQGYSVLEVIQSFEKVSGRKLDYEIVGRRSGDIEKIWADTTFANKELGWKAVLGIDEMMLSAWNWEIALKGE
ncbi:MAG: UDP-glucose 4-epimerase GalE [Bacteroidales bacterium]|jgi:UDP-glucose 4-epimerase|nr:UDP-glucose 4-epimerase GalE [Bacteroidales bacterium]